MVTLEIALVMLATVLVSAILDQLFTRLPLPLIQIGCGVLVSLFITKTEGAITLDPELFLVLFIAPLLFHEAREADKASLWHNRHSMFSYAIGLVVVIILVVGFTVNAFIPSIPLAAAFALGAALGPTDPIAVASVSKRANVPARQKTVLQGESLFNDASGIVSFQFAIAAVVTGSFSALQALERFAYSFIGALVLGILLGFLLIKLADKISDTGLENTTFHVSLELLTPFLAYLLGEALHVSGVILVVACGITMSIVPRGISPSASRINIVSSSVWDVFTFALNGVVFVLLGTQLPHAFGNMWVENGISNVDLIIYIVVLTLIVHGIRFIWTLCSEGRVYHHLKRSLTFGERMRSAAIMTLSGSKGAITLAIMFTIPFYIQTNDGFVQFPQRDLLIFLACGVILLSLLGATFIVPLLAPRIDDSEEVKARDDIAQANVLRAVIERLTARQNESNKASMSKVITQYTQRLERFKGQQDLEDDSDLALRVQALEWEQDCVMNLIDKDEISPYEGYQYLSRCVHITSMIKKDNHFKLKFLNWRRRFFMFIKKLGRMFNDSLPGDSMSSKQKTAKKMRVIQSKAAQYAVERLKEIMPESDLQSEKISKLIHEYERTLRLLGSASPSITVLARNVEPDIDIMKLALRIELEEIQNALDNKELSRKTALQMKQNVYLMQVDIEDFV